MTFLARRSATLLLAVAALALSGCVPYAPSQLDEEKEPHFLAGKSKVSALDYQGAIDCFEKALQVNPQSASAHLELGCLFETKEPDPAAAIYHYEHYLKLQPNAGNAEVIRQRIMTCKQELARTVSLGPVTEKLQHEFERLTDENKALREETNRLHDELEKWRAYASRVLIQTNLGTGGMPTARLATPPAQPRTAVAGYSNTIVSGTPPRAPSSAAVPSARTHTVKAGETPIMIARRYGVRLEALLAANPKLDTRRMQVGQTVNIP